MNQLKDKRVFIIEDDVKSMALSTALLDRQGATVLRDYWNYNIAELLSLYLPLDVILLDLKLRYGVSGYDIYQEIQAHPDTAHIPVVAVSAADPAVEIPKVRAMGFAGFISKPINLRLFP